MPRASAAEQLRRNRAIAVDRARGLLWSTIAERHKVSTRRAQQIWLEWSEHELAIHEEIDPLEELGGELLEVEALIEDLASLSEKTRNDSVRLGALKAKSDAQERKRELKRALGLIPSRLHSARGLIEAQLMAGVFREALQKVKIKGGEVAFEEFLEVVRDTFAEGDKQQRMLEDARRIRSLAWAEQERKADLEHRKPKPADATPNGDQDR